MPNIPAVCQDCRKMFSTMYDVHQGEPPQLFDGCMVGSCPDCGGEVQVPDGIWEAVDEVCLACAGECMTVPEIEHLLDIFACTSYQGPDQVAEAIRSAAPAYSSLTSPLIVTDEHSLIVDDAALCKVVSSCGAISDAIIENYAPA